MDDQEMMDLSWSQRRFGMGHWDGGVGMCATSSPVLFGGRDISSNMLIYPDVEVLTLTTERAQQSDNQNTETNDSRFFLRFGEGSFGHRLIGTLVLTAALLALSAALLSLYLQGSSRLDNIYTVRESLSLNLSHNMADMENLREDTRVLARNLSSLLDNISSIQEHTLSALMLNQTEILQEMEKQGQLYQMELRQYIHLQQRMEHISRTYLPIPQKSPLLRNCEWRNQGTICPFCSAGWHFFGLSCYLLSPQTRNWQDSLHWCRKQGAHLVVINSPEEQEFLQTAVKTSSWIGLSDRDMEGQWEWVDGTPYNSTFHRFWFQKQPDNLGNEDCAVLLPGSLWNDNKCRKLYSSVCEYKAGEIQLPKESLLDVLLGP
ncbi:C-type lectin domain family 10 member A-like [Bufo bufo]|uniref:C-type lectin domain family 10 member A-like n=1 Tax=Bufo bufo TaxID=8384 RepID=UPI001ABDCD7F|nr:C-type lectin domain family 10 member A-like [Bufo bufo]